MAVLICGTNASFLGRWVVRRIQSLISIVLFSILWLVLSLLLRRAVSVCLDFGIGQKRRCHTF
jgi:hypothetical protein